MGAWGVFLWVRWCVWLWGFHVFCGVVGVYVFFVRLRGFYVLCGVVGVYRGLPVYG